jgi:hypothetical protein
VEWRVYWGLFQRPLTRQTDSLVWEKWVFMLDKALMRLVAAQMMKGTSVEVDGKILRVTRTGSQRFRTVRFVMDGREYRAIEKNREKPSRWGQLARQGHQVVQFRDLANQRYVAVTVDSEVKEYGKR